MTYDELLDDIADALNITSDEGYERIGRSINRHNRRITAKLGLSATRKEQVESTVEIGNSDVTFLGVEKVLNVWIEIDDLRKTLEEKTVTRFTDAKLRETSDEPDAWAVFQMKATHVVIQLDKVPETAYTLYADVITTLAAIEGVESPSFAESFHDCLREFVIMDEYRKQEKLPEAKLAREIADDILADLKLFIARGTQSRNRQGSAPAPARMTRANG